MEWTKVSDGFPDKEMFVLVTVRSKIEPTHYYVDSCYYGYEDSLGMCFNYYDDEFEEIMELTGVVAWMPIPSPCVMD